MYTPTGLLLLLAAATGINAARLAERAAIPLAIRDAAQGWSVQSPSSKDGLTSCGGNGYCPSSLHCFDAKNSEVASCCSSNSACVGAIEGSPTCADPSWNLYTGIDGNGFCCMSGMVGVIDRSARTVNCVASNAVGSSSTAVLTKSGTGAAASSSATATNGPVAAVANLNPVAAVTNGAASVASAASSAVSSAASDASSAVSSASSAASSAASSIAHNGTLSSSSSGSGSGSSPANTAGSSTSGASTISIVSSVLALGVMAAALAL